MTRSQINEMKRINAIAQANSKKEMSSSAIRAILVLATLGTTLMGLVIIAKAAGL